MTGPSVLDNGFLAGLPTLRSGRRHRASSWDRKGGNADGVVVSAGGTHLLLDVDGAGTIRHIWMTIGSEEQYFLRKCVLRMYWDDSESPSVDTPVGDFFGMGHAATRNFVSAPLQMSPRGGRAFNCFFRCPSHTGRASSSKTRATRTLAPCSST